MRVRAISLDGDLTLPDTAPQLPGRVPDFQYGQVDVHRYIALQKAGIHLRVFLDGQDVTTRCRQFMDAEGWAELYPEERDSMAATFGQLYVRRQGVVVRQVAEPLHAEAVAEAALAQIPVVAAEPLMPVSGEDLTLSTSHALTWQKLEEAILALKNVHPVMLQDGRSLEWTCPSCHGDALWCSCDSLGESLVDPPQHPNCLCVPTYALVGEAGPEVSIDVQGAVKLAEHVKKVVDEAFQAGLRELTNPKGLGWL